MGLLNRNEMKNSYTFILFAFASLFFSCSNDSDVSSPDLPGKDVVATGVTATVAALEEGFIDSDITRSSLTFDGAQELLLFNWVEGDNIILYSNSTTDAWGGFSIKSGTDTPTAKFDGGGFKPAKGALYYSFSKADVALDNTLNGAHDKTKLMMTYEGQKQTGNDNSAHLGKYDFMYSKAVASEDNAAHFDYTHLGSVLRFILTVPVSGSFTRLTLEDYNANTPGKRLLYQTRQYCDLTESDTIPHLLKDDLKTGESIENTPFTLELQDISTDNANQIITLYMWIPAFNMKVIKDQKIKATLEASNGQKYYTSFNSTSFIQGRYYTIRRTLAKAGELNVAIRVDKDWKLGDTKEDKTRAGDPGFDEDLNLPTHVKVYTTVDRGTEKNKLYETTEFSIPQDAEWIREGKTNIYRLSKNAIIHIDNPDTDAKNVHVYAYANIKEPASITSVNKTTTADSEIQNMTFSVTMGSEQDVLKNLYSTTPAQGLTAYTSNDVMNVDLTLYHTAAKMDFQWDFTNSANRFEGFVANNLLNTGYLFKPTENATVNTSYTYTHDVGTNAAEKYAGRHVFYAIQQGGTNWPLSVTTKKTNASDITKNITFTPSVTNGWTSWLKANITPAPPAP